MCLVTLQRQPRITKQDKIVWKVVEEDGPEDGCMSHFFHYLWKEGDLEQTALDVRFEKFSCSDATYDTMATRHIKGQLNKKYQHIVEEHARNFKMAFHAVTVIRDGFHAALTKKRLYEIPGGCVLRQFLIPKGSAVYTDGSGLIVANQMMLLPIIPKR